MSSQPAVEASTQTAVEGPAGPNEAERICNGRKAASEAECGLGPGHAHRRLRQDERGDSEERRRVSAVRRQWHHLPRLGEARHGNSDGPLRTVARGWIRTEPNGHCEGSKLVSIKKHVVIYTDGACSPNPGPGGYGVVLMYGEHRREYSGGYRSTTNNRMELLAPIIGLSALNQSCRVTVYSDSRYVVDGIQKGWARTWRANGWMRNKKESAVNPDLWDRLLDLCDKHDVEFRWVRGHSGDPENERCDRLAVEASKGPDLAVDEGYEHPIDARALFSRSA